MAASNRPAITFVDPSPAAGSTVTTAGVPFAFSYNRTGKQTRVLTCTLSGLSASSGPCATPVTSGKNATSGVSYEDLANGAYTLTVTLTLTDGGTTTVSRAFTVDVPTVGYIYWTIGLGAGEHGIGRANLDGTDVNQSFIAGATNPADVAFDDHYIYWTNSTTGTIGRANADGSGVDQDFITGVSSPTPGLASLVAIAVDAGHIYWTNYHGGTIGRADLDGTDVDENFITGATRPNGIDVDANHIYWTNGSWIGRANLDGTDVDTSFIASIQSSSGIAVDGHHVYWGSSDTPTVTRANLDGSNPVSFAVGTHRIRGVAVDAGHLYWAQPGTGTITRVDLDGTNLDGLFIPSTSSPIGVEVDARG